MYRLTHDYKGGYTYCTRAQPEGGTYNRGDSRFNRFVAWSIYVYRTLRFTIITTVYITEWYKKYSLPRLTVLRIIYPARKLSSYGFPDYKRCCWWL